MHRLLALLTVLTLLLASCSGASTRTQWDGPPRSEAESAYRDAVEVMESGQFIEATKRFNRVRLKYPYSSRWTTLSELRLADILFEQSRYGQASSLYQQFVKGHPTHEEVAYSLFRIGECHYEKMPSSFFLFPDPWQRELRHIRASETAYQRFLIKYPDSEHAPRATEHLTEVRTLLAQHDLYAAEYYLKRDRFLGALNRLLALSERYHDLAIMDQALFLMAQSYILLNDIHAASRALARLLADHPDSDYAEDARAWLDTVDLRDAKPMPVGPDLIRERKIRARR